MFKGTFASQQRSKRNHNIHNVKHEHSLNSKHTKSDATMGVGGQGVVVGGGGVFRSDCPAATEDPTRCQTPILGSNGFCIPGLIPTLTADLRWDLTSSAAMLPYCASKRSENSRYLSHFDVLNLQGQKLQEVTLNVPILQLSKKKESN